MNELHVTHQKQQQQQQQQQQQHTECLVFPLQNGYANGSRCPVQCVSCCII